MEFANRDFEQEYKELDRQLPRQTVHLNGGDFTYRYYKHPDPQKNVTIILLPGGTGLAAGFFPYFKELMKRYNVIAFNYPMAFRNYINMADAVAALIKTLRVRNVYLLGQSYGGILAQIIAKRHPESIKGMILCSTCSLSNDIRFEGMTRMAQMLSVEKERENLKKDEQLTKEVIAPMLKDLFKKTLPDGGIAEMFCGLIDAVSEDLSAEYVYLMDTLLGDLRNEFGRHKKEDFLPYTNEVLIIFSKEDHIFTDDLKEALVRLMPEPVVKWDLKGGHLASLISFDEFAQEVNSFIDARN